MGGPLHAFYGVLGGAVTVKLTLGPLLVVVVEVVLLETTPLESTPTMVNVYVFAGVTPLGVVVVVLAFPHPGVKTKTPHSISNASLPHYRSRLIPELATQAKAAIPDPGYEPRL